MWVGWTDREFDALREVLDGYEASHPGVKVNAVAGQSDEFKVTQAVTAGNGPDLATAFGTANLAKLCTSGVLQDLGSLEDRGSIKAGLFPPAAQHAFDFAGHRCALPFLADTFALYYRPDLLAEAGFSGPPATVEELAAMAVKLTKFNPDGSIRVAGFVPLTGFLENYVTRYAAWFGASYFDQDGHAQLSRDPRWASIFRIQKRIIDAIGYDKLKAFTAGLGEEFSPANPFEAGKLAMELDGEWRTQAIAKEQPNLAYATAPLPAPGGDAAAGASEVGVTLLGIPRGAGHPAEAWELARYLATETGPLVRFANALHNLPTTKAALASPQLSMGEHFGPFIQAFSDPRSSFPDIIGAGPVYFDPITAFAERWQSGKVDNLEAGLAEVDRQIDRLVAQP